MKTIAAVAVACAALFAASGCKEKVAATVACKVVEGGSVECTVTQTEGKSAMEVCWEFKVSCESGATLETAKSCGTVSDGGQTTTTISGDKVTINGECDTVKSAEVTNMSWSAK